MTSASFRCSCGARYDSSDSQAAAIRIIDRTRQEHLRLGHHEVDQAEYRRIVRRQRRAEWREVKSSER